MKGQSEETVLHSLVGHIEKSNDLPLYRIRARSINYTVSTSKLYKAVNRGTPQDGVLSPLL